MNKIYINIEVIYHHCFMNRSMQKNSIQSFRYFIYIFSLLWQLLYDWMHFIHQNNGDSYSNHGDGKFGLIPLGRPDFFVFFPENDNI